MKIKNHTTLILSMLSLILLTGCFQERIDLDLNTDENKKVVILGWLNDIDDNQRVTVSYSQDYFDNSKEFIDDALVTLSSTLESLTLENSSNGEYLLPADWKGIPGTEYTLTVLHNEEEYSATSLLRDMPVSQDLETVYSYDEEDSIGYYLVLFGFQDTPGLGDGYFLIDYKKESDQKDIIMTGAWADDEYGDGQYYGDITATENYHQLGDTVILETHSVGKKATVYFESIINEIFNDGLLDPPPVNVPDNFSNGAVGYFITAGKKTYEVVIE